MSATKCVSTTKHWNLKHGECLLRLLSEVLMDIQVCAPLSVMPMSCWLAPGWLRWMRQYGPCQELSLTCWADDTQHKCDPVGLIPHSTAPQTVPPWCLAYNARAADSKSKHFTSGYQICFVLFCLFCYLSMRLNWNAWWNMVAIFALRIPGHAGSGTWHYSNWISLITDTQESSCMYFVAW